MLDFSPQFILSNCVNSICNETQLNSNKILANLYFTISYLVRYLLVLIICIFSVLKAKPKSSLKQTSIKDMFAKKKIPDIVKDSTTTTPIEQTAQEELGEKSDKSVQNDEPEQSSAQTEDQTKNFAEAKRMFESDENSKESFEGFRSSPDLFAGDASSCDSFEGFSSAKKRKLSEEQQ